MAAMLNDADSIFVELVDSVINKYSDGDKRRLSLLYGFKGDYLLTQDKVLMAMKNYESALELYYDNVLVLNNYAYHLALGNMELRKADKMMARAIELQPNDINLLDTYAWVFFTNIISIFCNNFVLIDGIVAPTAILRIYNLTSSRQK